MGVGPGPTDLTSADTEAGGKTAAGLLTGITSAAAIAAGLSQASNLSGYGSSLKGELTALGRELAANSAFKGYGVTSGLGNTTIGTDGSVNLGVEQNGMFNNYATQAMNNSQTLMAQAMEDPAARQQAIYNQIMAAQNPQLNAMQAQQQAREMAMGRGGVRGSQFGGTAEDAAMARARVQGSNEAALGARQAAVNELAQMGALASQYGQLGQQAYQTSFLPMQQQMQLLQIAGADADRAQTGQLTGQGYLAQLGLGGAQVDVNAKKAASELRGNIIDSILDNAGGFWSSIFGD
jgi:hypothetical protein